MPLLRSLCTALILVLALAAPAARAAAPMRPVNVLVVTEDFDSDTIPRDNRIYVRVIAALQEALNARGFQVYDETGIGLDITRAHQVRRRDDQLLEIAAAASPPMDAIVIFRIYASVRQGSTDIRRPELLIPGRVLNVQTKQIIANFEVGSETQFPPLPLDCDDRECLLTEVGKRARLIAADLGQTLADKMQAFISAPSGPAPPAPLAATATTAPGAAPQPDDCANLPTAYHLKFRDFSTRQFNEIEELLTSFGCYRGHRIAQSGRTYLDVWYETSADSARLNRNLRRALDHISAPGNITQGSNNSFEIVSTNTR